MHVGALPPECALLTRLSSGIEEMAITASIEGDPDHGLSGDLPRSADGLRALPRGDPRR